MHPELQQTLSQFAHVQSLDIKKVSRFTPADFRHGIQWLLAEDNPDLAQVLAEAGLGIYPQSEDILAIAGLLAMTREDWTLAIELLHDLCEVQQDLVQPMTYQMLARAYGSNLDVAEARQVLIQGLQAFPQDPMLLAEQATLESATNALPAAKLCS